MSPFTTSIHSFFGLPLGFSPSPSKTVQPFTQSQSSCLSTCPNHLSLFRFTTTPIASTPILSLNITLVILSLRDTHIILILLISALSSFASCSALIGHVSLPYIIQLRIQLLLTFPFSNSEAPFLASICDSSLNLFHALRTLATTAESAPPSALILSPK